MTEKDEEKFEELVIKGAIDEHNGLVSKINELRTRVAELEDVRDGYEKQRDEDVKYIEHMEKHVAELENENKTLLEQSLYGINHGVELQMANKELQNRLSTLLKASEGMEKALDRLIGESDARSVLYAHSDVAMQQARASLADFRDVKGQEGKRD